MARVALALLVAVLVAAGCGSSGGHSTTAAGVAVPGYTLHQVKAAFAAQGIRLDRMLGTRHLIVLRESGWYGPFGYQHVGREQPSVTQFLVFVGDGPHSQRRGNVWVDYSDGEGPAVKAALRQLGTGRSRVKPVSLSGVRTCLERHGWPVERFSRKEIDSQHGAVVWDITFRRTGPPVVGWTGGPPGHEPAVLALCLQSAGS